MSCSCHGKTGRSVTRTSPYDQCTACAKKHIVKAWNLFNEYTYTDDNRDVISGQLRLAVDHLMFDHAGIALPARNLAIQIEENRDAEIGDGWETLLKQIREAYLEEHPDIAERRKEMI